MFTLDKLYNASYMYFYFKMIHYVLKIVLKSLVSKKKRMKILQGFPDRIV